MIYTVTLNPAVDLILHIKNLQPGEIHRTNREYTFPGGKGINVSRMLQRYNTESTALGFIGGFTGEYIRNALQQEGILTEFIEIPQDTRINVKIKNDVETEINGQGPDLEKDDIESFLQLFDQMTSEDHVVLSGSKPTSLPNDFYQLIIQRLLKNKVSFTIDTTGRELLDSLDKKPFLIKPNRKELEEIFPGNYNSPETFINSGEKLLEMGAQNVMISMGREGSYLFTKEEIYKAEPPKGKKINSVGSGDSMIGAFLARFVKNEDLKDAFYHANMAGTATAFTEDLATWEQIKAMEGQIKIIKIKGSV